MTSSHNGLSNQPPEMSHELIRDEAIPATRALLYYHLRRFSEFPVSSPGRLKHAAKALLWAQELSKLQEMELVAHWEDEDV